MDNQMYIDRTKAWIQQFVIQHNLCPFASKPFFDDRIGYYVIPNVDPETLLRMFFDILLLLKEKSDISNAFVILPEHTFDFETFLELFGMVENILENQNLDETFQLVSFHPAYRFANLAVDHPVHLTNRSPYCMIHILRVQEVSQAIEAYGDTDKILEHNKEKLISLFN